MTKAAVLSFTSSPEPIEIKIDGKPFHIRHPEALSLGQMRRVETGIPRLSYLLKSPAPTPAQDDEASALLAELTPDVLIAPADVIARLSDLQRLSVMTKFVAQRPGSEDPEQLPAEQLPRARRARAKRRQ